MTDHDPSPPDIRALAEAALRDDKAATPGRQARARAGTSPWSVVGSRGCEKKCEAMQILC